MTTQREFIDFLASLAPDGETALIVRQRPRRDDASQFTFPAQFPDAKVPEGSAVFGNTASYVIDRLDPKRPSASLGNAGGVLVMMLDDIGTKVGTPPVSPTWIIETSPGSFQWGYAFSVLPTVGAFSAAIRALADAGFTDPGSVNAARNFRIPGSVNLKPGRDNYAAQLREFHPERKFTLHELLKAFDVTPGEASATIKPVGIVDDGANDDVLIWMQSQGLVLGRANAEGWVSVVCPNNAAHTDGKVEGRYHPSDRGYKCLHAHCQHITTEDFLSWVGENGGPKVSLGLRSELLTERLRASLDKLAPQPNPVVQEIENREKQRLEKAEWFTRYAYIESDDAYFDIDHRKVVTRSAFNAIYRHVACKNIKTDAYCEASIWYDQNRAAMGAKSLVSLTYAAGDGALVSHNGELKGNLWVDARPDVSTLATQSQDMSQWVDLCRRLVPEASELDHIWDVMAFKVQNPRVKINHAILHMGDEGTGKDSMWAPFLWAVCGPDHRNRAIVNGGELSSSWGYAYESEVLVLNELHEPEAAQRRALANRLKPLIAAPPETISINRKMLRPYESANRLFVLAFSNEAVPISISSQDRRWFVIRSQAARLPEAQATALWTWYRAGGMEAIAAWLHARDVSAFNPAAIPPMTEEKASMIEGGLTTGEDYLCGLATRRAGEFARGVVGSRWSAVVDRLQATAPQGVKLNKHALFHALKEAKWVHVGRIMSAEHTSKVDVWCAPDMAHLPKSELRGLVEPAQLPKAPADNVVTPFRRG